MSIKRKNYQSKNGKKVIILLLIVIILVVLASIVLYWHDHSKTTPTPATSASVSVSKKTTPTSQTPPASNNSTGQGGVIDQNGQTSGALPPSSDWVSSSNGAITLQQPSANTVLQSGATLSGTANVNNVQFILSDNSVGLIAEGNLNVVNGKFSGILKFTPHAKTGTLEVYYPNPANGAEEDIINIDVNFNY